MRRIGRGRWLGVGISAAIVASTVMAPPAFANKKDNSVRFAHEEVLNHADPYYSATDIAGIVADSIWDTLIYRDPATGVYEGELATAWRWADDKTLELDLREGVRFHNGAAFGADDVVYTLNFVSKPENRAVNFNLVRWIDHVDKVGPYKVRIVGKLPNPAAVAFLASRYMVMHPHDYYARVGPDGMNKKPVGTGPFRVVEHALGKYLRLERNSDYFKDSPKARPEIDRIEIRFIPDAQTRVAETVAGGLDLIVNVARDQAEQLKGVSGLSVRSGPAVRYAYLQLNSLDRTPAPPLRDVRVRQAIMYAIDREAMAKFLVGGGSRVLHAECHPDQFGCADAGVPRYEYNPGKARQLLTQAGYVKGFDIDLYARRDRNQAEAMVGYLNTVGIRVHLRFMQQAAMTAARRSGRAALAFSDTGSFDVADLSMAASYYHEFAPTDSNRDAELRDLLIEGDSAMDPDARKATYAKALKLIAERAYVLPLYTMPNYQIAAADLITGPYSGDLPRFYEMSWK